MNIYPEPKESFTTHRELRYFNASSPAEASQSSAGLYSEAPEILLPTNFVLKLKAIFLGMSFENSTFSCFPGDPTMLFYCLVSLSTNIAFCMGKSDILRLWLVTAGLNWSATSS